MLLIFVLILSALLYFYTKKKYNFWTDRNVIHPTPKFPYGNLSEFNGQHFGLGLHKLYQKYKGKLNFFGIYIFLRPATVILDLDLAKQILIKDFQHLTDRGLYSNPKVDPQTGDLLRARGAKWKNLRSKFTPMFTSGKLKLMFPIMLSIGERFREYLDEKIDGAKRKEVDVKEAASRFTTDIIGSTGFGIEINSLREDNNAFRNACNQLLSGGPSPLKRIFSDTFPSVTNLFRFKLLNKTTTSYFRNVIQETIDYREKNNVQRNDFLNLMIQLKNEGKIDGDDDVGYLTMDEIFAQSILFFIAGFETTATSTSFCLYELAKNPEYQEKARQSIAETIKKHNELSYEAINDMHYLEQCINETLRLHPPGSALGRVVTSDSYTLPGTNLTLEKGHRIFIPTYAIHHDAEYYPNPDIFDPSRFAPEQIQKRHALSFLPFSDGPRNCIGMRLAYLELKIGLVHLLTKFRFSLSENTSVKYGNKGLTLTPENELLLNVEKI
uniref:Putative cytochrome n=1 Tax=Corethrella appendiculata TaxID=1370023 RepID=U5ENJ2_9DIPT